MKYAFYLGVLVCLTTIQCTGKKPQQSNDELVDKREAQVAKPLVRAEKVENSHEKVWDMGDFLSCKNVEQLAERVGQSNLRHAVELFEEGTVEKEVTWLYKGSDDELHFVWNTEGPTISCSHPKSKWTYKGLKCGTSLLTLTALNGGAIHFSGFGWDYGGCVLPGDGQVDKMDAELVMQASKECPNIEMLTGDRRLSTDVLCEEQLEHIHISRISIGVDVYK